MNVTMTILPWAILAFAMATLLAGWRLVRGPSLADRVLALDTLYINSLALLILFGMYWRTTLFFEAALVIAMMGFVGTAVLARFLARGSIVE